MAIRSILTSYIGDGGGDSALRLAVQMAQKYDARLTAAVWQPANPLRIRPASFLTREIDAILDQAETEFAETRRAAFDERVAQAGLQGRTDFVSLSGSHAAGLAAYARGHDIVVMGGGPAALRGDSFAVRPDVVALRSGRPVFIVPPGYSAERIRETAVIAWDGKRAAARALSDAMHILGTKEHVTLLSIGSGPAPDHLQGAQRLMALHGIEAEIALRPAGPGGIGRTILDACSELGAGQLYMGAYEHSKFSEDLIGGVTRDILENAPIPVMMSH
ncbi:universal stress protein [Paracoccus luteus]|uniref:universal stress protein n=1 Tax=Paracoccus luteus TaxID=2508543 RepID=UPI00106F96F6|nr:universal stress protein [Paracoccus luteus]